MAQYFEGRRSVSIHPHDEAVSEMLPPGPIRLGRLTRSQVSHPSEANSSRSLAEFERQQRVWSRDSL